MNKSGELFQIYFKVTIINGYKFLRILKVVGLASNNFTDFPKIYV